MPRTTLDLDASVLRELKRLKQRANKSLGQLVSELVSAALAGAQAREGAAPIEFAWTARAMGALVDLEDKEALRAALESQ